MFCVFGSPSFVIICVAVLIGIFPVMFSVVVLGESMFAVFGPPRGSYSVPLLLPFGCFPLLLVVGYSAFFLCPDLVGSSFSLLLSFSLARRSTGSENVPFLVVLSALASVSFSSLFCSWC